MNAAEGEVWRETGEGAALMAAWAGTATLGSVGTGPEAAKGVAALEKMPPGELLPREPIERHAGRFRRAIAFTPARESIWWTDAARRERAKAPGSADRDR